MAEQILFERLPRPALPPAQPRSVPRPSVGPRLIYVSCPATPARPGRRRRRSTSVPEGLAKASRRRWIPPAPLTEIRATSAERREKTMGSRGAHVASRVSLPQTMRGTPRSRRNPRSASRLSLRRAVTSLSSVLSMGRGVDNLIRGSDGKNMTLRDHQRDLRPSRGFFAAASVLLGCTGAVPWQRE